MYTKIMELHVFPTNFHLFCKKEKNKFCGLVSTRNKIYLGKN